MEELPKVKNRYARFTFTSFCSIAGEVANPTVIVKNFARRSYVIENDEYPSDAKIFRKVVNITLDLTPEYVTCCWKMAGLCNKTNSEAEIEQVFL